VADAVADKVRLERLHVILEETRGALRTSPSWQTADEAYAWVREMREDRTA
jgi:hypothetical protein